MSKILMKKSHVLKEFHVISAPYCALQSLLRYEVPVGYTATKDGWGSDLYFVPYNSNYVVISTGYAPFGNIKVPYDDIREFEKTAQQISDAPHELKELVKRFINQSMNKYFVNAGGF